MIYAIRNIEKSLGNKKYLTPSEKKTLRLLKKIVKNTNIKKGELISIDKIGIKDLMILTPYQLINDLVLNIFKKIIKDEAI